MRVLIIGSGGREHTIAWKVSQSEKVKKLYALPGNAGMARVSETVPIDAADVNAAADFAEANSIDLTVVGPESPLIAGIVDEFQNRGLAVFGPNRDAAQMEGSKVFAKQLMLENGIPTAGCEVFEDADRASAYIDAVAAKTDAPIVVKADGEAAGKGVFVSKTKAEALQAVDAIMNRKLFGASGDKLVIEEFLDGPEATLMCFVDGEVFVPMMPAQDYKRAYDNDEGPNTGGMGCYSPVPAFTPEVEKTAIDSIVKPTLKALAAKGIHYKGVLYCGLALTSSGPQVVEFNVRIGDPEAQVVLPLLETDFVEIAQAVIEGRLDEIDVTWYNRRALCVVIASGGYPGDYEKGKLITGIDEAENSGALVFHAGTKADNGGVVTSGGRVLGVTALGDTFQSCIDGAYAGVDRIRFDGARCRRDIGARLVQD